MLNNHSGAETFEKVIIISEPCAGFGGEAYAKVQADEWLSCSVNVCCITGDLSAYFDTDQADFLTDQEIGKIMMR